jgi:uncharacterized LabA/DUF88 family protein
MNQKSQPRTIVYVDGFNFYYGAVKGTTLKWLDYRALAAALLRGHQIDAVKYFIARVQDRPDDLGLSQRQDTYIRALEAYSKIEVHYGQFQRRPKRRPLADKLAKGVVEMVTVIDTEEKGSDVSLGSHLVWDACHRNMNAALVMSNDSDLQTPVTMAEQAGVRVITVNPHKQSDQPRRLRSSDKRTLNRRLLVRSQLPNPVTDDRGEQILKPPEWS